MTKKFAIGAAAAAITACGIWNVGAMAAHADCVQADVYVLWTGSQRQYVIGPNQCAVPTPWNWSDNVIAETEQHGLPPGTLSGAGVNVWVPLP